MSQSTLPPLDDEVAIDDALVDGFGRDGHVLVRQLATREEAAAYAPIIEAAAVEHAWNKLPMEERDTYGKAFLQSANLWRREPDIARFVLSRRFGRAAARLLTVDRVRLFHDQALCKEAGGGYTPWHQDHYYWPFDTDKTITMWMPLVDVGPEVGSMTFVTGSHELGDLRGGSISDESDDELRELIEQRQLPTHTYGAVTAGDATFHAGWTVHSAGPNPSDRMRTVMTIIYVADGARVLPALTPAQDLDRRLWLRVEPGALVDSERNPIVG